MPITNRNLVAGTRLAGKHKGVAYSALVTEDGQFEVQDKPDMPRFKSPSAAGSAIMGGTACNGWRFWSVEGKEPPTTPPDTANTASKAPTPSAATKTPKLIKRTPNQNGVAEGSVRYFCTACMKGFEAHAGPAPARCPEGHGAELMDEIYGGETPAVVEMDVDADA